MIKRPLIAIFDEATAHLDSECEAAVYQSLRTILNGCITIVIAHRLSTVRLADQILVLVNGQIVERGRHSDMLTPGKLYTRLWETQYGSNCAGLE